MYSASSDSEPSFDSPSEDDNDDEDFDADEDGHVEMAVGLAPPSSSSSKAFRGPPVMESQPDEESIIGGSPLALATQPYMAITSAHNATTTTTPASTRQPPPKKRKVSVSPYKAPQAPLRGEDSLAQIQPSSSRRNSPRSGSPRSKTTKRNTQVIDMVVVDENEDIFQQTDGKRKNMQKQMTSADSTQKVEDIRLVLPDTRRAEDGEKERDSIKTTLFPGEEGLEASSTAQQGSKSTAIEKKKVTKITKKKAKTKSYAVDDTEERRSLPTPKVTTKTSSIQSKPSSETSSPDSGPRESPSQDSSSALLSSKTTKPTSINSSETVPEVKPPSKKKKKKKSFQDELLHLMFMTGKPYTVKCLTQQSLTNGASESAIEFCFLSLVDKGWVIKKEFAAKSRTKELFWGNQECKNKELMEILDMVPPQQINQAREELQQLQQQNSQVSRELAMMTKEPSNEELNAQVQEIERQVQELEQRLKEMRERIRGSHLAAQQKPPGRQLVGANTRRLPGGGGGSGKKPISTKRMKQKINEMRLQWKKRKDKCMEFVENMADAMESKPKDVMKLVQVETDEMAGVTMPPKYDV